MPTENEFRILLEIHNRTGNIRQRDLAEAADLSLGMTNIIIKKLVNKGLLVMKRVTTRNVQYALTPNGVKEIFTRSRRHLRLMLDSVAEYRTAMENLADRIAATGYQSVRLSGSSRIDFILEWACLKKGLEYNPPVNIGRTWFVKPSELLDILSLIKSTQLHPIEISSLGRP